MSELYHHGILGQRWGVRRTPEQLGHKQVSYRKVERLAKKDAKEQARAKMFYGEGAGNRRKLIKNTIAERSKNPHYKEALERYAAKQDMADHAKKAKMERNTKDAWKKVKRVNRGVVAVAGTAAALYSIGHFTGLNSKIAAWGKTAYSAAVTSIHRRRGKLTVDDILRR